MTFSEKLLELRKAHGLSQEEVAKEIKIGVRVYQRYEYGEREPRLSTLIALADVYGISLDELTCHAVKKRKKR